MSAIVIFAPIIITSWPVISAAVVATVGAMGYTAVNVNQQVSEEESIDVGVVELEVANSEVVGATLAREEELEFERDGITLKFRRDIRGALKITVKGESYSKSQLEAIGDEIAQKVTQQYMYNRVISELQQNNFAIVDQEVGEDETIKIRIRNWE